VVNGRRATLPTVHDYPDRLAGSTGTAETVQPIKTTCGNCDYHQRRWQHPAVAIMTAQGGGVNPTSWNFAHPSKG